MQPFGIMVCDEKVFNIFETLLANLDITRNIFTVIVCELLNEMSVIVDSARMNVVAVHGCRDLFWLPIEQYRRDGRIVRGFQRGAQSFMTCTAMSTLELTNRVVQVIQVTDNMHFIVFYYLMHFKCQ